VIDHLTFKQVGRKIPERSAFLCKNITAISTGTRRFVDEIRGVSQATLDNHLVFKDSLSTFFNFDLLALQ
jgi:hypothetical protein